MGRKLLLTATLAPVVVAGATRLRNTARAAVSRRSRASVEPGVPTPAPSAGLAAAVAIDTLVSLPIALLSSTGSTALYRRASDELDDAVLFYGDAGWLDDPAGRHRTPRECPDGRITPAGSRGSSVEMLRFDSGWEPEAGEPGADRWRSFRSNTSVPVRLLRHPGAPRPWLVAVHGQGMGRASDLRMLRVRRLRDQLGINIALPALPLHGPRAAGLAADQQFVSNLFVVNNVLGLTQAVWDVRRLLLWLRATQGAPAIGLLGLSLGSYACSLLSTLDGDVACVIPVVPTSDLAASLRAAEPLSTPKQRLHRALHDKRSTMVHAVVSPLARPCLVPRDRRFIVAGQADRIAPPAGAAQLWRHWDEPSILWRPRGHVTTPRSTAYDDHLTAIITASGLAATQHEGEPCAS